MFYCFGCHKGGNVINFIQEIETIPYYQAAQILAERANVRLPKTEMLTTAARPSEKDWLWLIPRPPDISI